METSLVSFAGPVVALLVIAVVAVIIRKITNH